MTKTSTDPRVRSASVSARVVGLLRAEPGLHVRTDVSAFGLVWASWSGSDAEGYWVATGTVIGGTNQFPTGSGFVTVSWMDEHDGARDILRMEAIPAAAVGDGDALALMALSALRLDRDHS